MRATSPRLPAEVDPMVARVGFFEMFQQAPQAPMAVDAAGTIVHCNAAGLALAEKVVAGSRRKAPTMRTSYRPDAGVPRTWRHSARRAAAI